MIAAATQREEPNHLLAPLRRVSALWNAPVTAWPLAWFRIGLSVVLLAQALSLSGHLDQLYGRHGVVDWAVIWESPPPGVPTLAWLNRALGLIGVPPATGVPLVFALYVGGLLGLLLGFRTRSSAVVAWLAHIALVTSGDMGAYGVDRFAQIGLFYCVWFPVGRELSLDGASRCMKPDDTDRSFMAWLGLRILQLHVCIFYTASGVEKALGQQWWSGEAIWRAVMNAPLGGSPIDCSFLANVWWLARGLCWMTLLLEAGVVAFVWHPRLRRVWLAGIVGLHLGIALMLNLWTFSATMIVFDLAAFGFRPPELRHSFPEEAHKGVNPRY